MRGIYGLVGIPKKAGEVHEGRGAKEKATMPCIADPQNTFAEEDVQKGNTTTTTGEDKD